MAARNRNPNKPELVAIYRLEFYKNKKNWKLTSERHQDSAKTPVEPKKTSFPERNSTLNETYNVEPVSDSEKDNSTLNNAFMHDIPTDEPAPLEIAEPSPPPPTPQPQVPPPTPQPQVPPTDQIAETNQLSCHKDVWCPTPQTQQDKFHQDAWSDLGIGEKQQPLKIAQEQPNWTNHSPTDNQNKWTNHDQPANNLQWLLKTSGLHTWHKQPPNPALLLPNTWHNQAKSVPGQTAWCRQPTPNPVATQDTWKIPQLAHQDKNTSETSTTTLKDKISWHNQDDQQCPKTQFNNQDPKDILKFQNNQDPNPQKEEQHFILPDTSVPPPPFRRHPQNVWPRQKNPQEFQQDTWINQTGDGILPEGVGQDIPDLQHLLKPGDILQAKLQTNLVKSDAGSEFGPQKLVQGMWTNQGTFCSQKGPDALRNERLADSNIDGLSQNVWVNQAWQEKQDLWQNDDKEGQEWVGPDTADVPDRLYEEQIGTCAEPQVTQADQCTVKPQPALECYEIQTPEQIRQHTDCWLRRLMRVYRLNDDWYTDCEPLCEQYQRGYNESSDFVREAHDVAHSSENDPNDTLEWIWSLTSPSSLPALSSRRLASAIRHVTNTLRSLLGEQLIRDQLRAQRAVDLEEYPTRDTELFDSEYVLAGSHLPRNTRELSAGNEQTRVIKIDMGRPYRL